MESDETEVDSMDVKESLKANAAAIDSESLHQWALATTLHDPIVAIKPFSTCYVFKVTVRCHCCELTAAVYLQE
ncbi:hypothetical protein OsI_09154 [Oryza sativa Indica Group]|uniref:Uncharacterized protein n=1 Tax=Oryza sativa subsp. indica TaxID=39946 RepID=B8AJH4_ORYSI|nr:hypothetical protein OsI_09154 [Oryza sativa Indica Group]